MSVAIWPAELPKPSREGYQAQRVDARARRSGGPVPGYRRRFSSAPELVSLSLIDVPRALKEVFDNFYRLTTADGVLPFLMPDPVTDGWPLLGPDGQSILQGDHRPVLLSAQWLCLFGDQPPVETISGVRFDIAFSVAVLP
ncbi:hypothetical protein [Cognatiyoonia sp. IB215182]|uniref:hypothetical protein n=1 Tax=Cognatiyoonia sp. IB215182 TaxID=3097353 RepID=UPI002A0CDD29|nr:hypothetical protein [Cognatiyoonia sp. IB215182]MDX8354361.1 hypothetical protein [Cognatiyoonia sp. IB215182]